MYPLYAVSGPSLVSLQKKGKHAHRILNSFTVKYQKKENIKKKKTNEV